MGKKTKNKKQRQHTTVIATERDTPMLQFFLTTTSRPLNKLLGTFDFWQNEMQKVLDKFVAVAKRYCEWAESRIETSQEDLLILQQLLTELHLSVLSLPAIVPENDVDIMPLAPETFATIRQRFAALPLQNYWDTFNPFNEEMPVFNIFADDLADIYHDIKQYFPLYEQGQYNEAMWQWRYNYQIHWGKHLIGAQRALHHYFYYS